MRRCEKYAKPRSRMDKMAEETGLQVYFEDFGPIHESKLHKLLTVSPKILRQNRNIRRPSYYPIPDAVERDAL